MLKSIFATVNCQQLAAVLNFAVSFENDMLNVPIGYNILDLWYKKKKKKSKIFSDIVHKHE